MEKVKSKLPFDEWLYKRSGHTQEELLKIALATGPYKEYKAMMAWYLKRYELETDNPFLTDEKETIREGENK